MPHKTQLGRLFALSPLGSPERAAGAPGERRGQVDPYARLIGLCGVTASHAAARRMGAALMVG